MTVPLDLTSVTLSNKKDASIVSWYFAPDMLSSIVQLRVLRPNTKNTKIRMTAIKTTAPTAMPIIMPVLFLPETGV